MKNYKLDEEELKILKDIEAGKYKTVKNIQEELKSAQEAARLTLIKSKNINIRLTLQDLQRIKAKALEHGLPYQTLVSALLHQYADRKIKIAL